MAKAKQLSAEKLYEKAMRAHNLTGKELSKDTKAIVYAISQQTALVVEEIRESRNEVGKIAKFTRFLRKLVDEEYPNK